MRTYVTILFTTLLLTLPFSTYARQNQWQQQLKRELQVLDTARAVDTWQRGADTLRALAEAHPDEWLLQYYTGWAYTQLSFQVPKQQTEAMCDKAEAYVKKALEMQPGNTETLTLMAYWLSARINANPSRGASLGPDSRRYSDKAIAADSSNPRAYLMKALVIYHTPALFGGGKKKAQPVVEEAAQKFAGFKPRSELAPNWGNNIFKELAASYQ